MLTLWDWFEGSDSVELSLCSTKAPDWGPLLLALDNSLSLTEGFLEAAEDKLLTDLEMAFSVDTSAGLLCLGPGLAVAGCLEGTEVVLAGLLVDLAAAPVAGAGLGIFLFAASLADLSAAKPLHPSFSSSFLGDAGFFKDNPGLVAWFSA